MTRVLGRPDTANDADEGQPLWKRQGTSNRVRTASGVCNDAETPDPERVGNREHIGGPIAVPAFGLVRGTTESGTVDSDQPHTRTVDHRSVKWVVPVQPRPRVTVETEQRRSVPRPHLRVCHLATGSRANRSLNHCRDRAPGTQRSLVSRTLARNLLRHGQLAQAIKRPVRTTGISGSARMVK